MKKKKILFALLITICYTLNSRANDSIIEEVENSDLLLLEISTGIFFLLCVFIIHRIRRTKKCDCPCKIMLEKLSQTDKNIDIKQELYLIKDKIKSLEQRLSRLELSSSSNQYIINTEYSNNKAIAKGDINGDIDQNVTNKKTNNNIEQNPQPITFQSLTVEDGKLVKADAGQAIYYQMWNEGNKNIFTFVNNEKTKKAINNRTILIDPFCDEQDNSIYPDESNFIDVCKPGILSDSLTVEEKIKIKYK